MLRKLAAIVIAIAPVACSTPVTDVSSSSLMLWSNADDSVPNAVMMSLSLPDENAHSTPARCLSVQSSIVVLVNDQPAYLENNGSSGDDGACVDPQWMSVSGYAPGVAITLVFKDSSG